LANSFFRYADFTLRATIRELIQRNKYDWIIWEHPYYGWLAKLIKEDTGIRTLIHTHNIEFQRFRSLGKPWWPLLKPYEEFAFNTADKISFITAEDQEFAKKEWNIATDKCLEIPFGIVANHYPEDRLQARNEALLKHGIAENKKILLFNGALDYAPNLEALKNILKYINPRLLKKLGHSYTLIICGKGLPKKMNQLKSYEEANILYAGFVDDIDLYFKAADILLNPIQKGGGVKTKMIEAIGMGTPVVATRSGAIGVQPAIAGPMISITDDNDWDGFLEAIVTMLAASNEKGPLPPSAFYEKYNWDSIMDSVIPALSN
jgi:glycosyltransferase involved in cell wall biosynthesis